MSLRFELGLTTVEVAAVSGHKTLAMLKRNTRLDAAALAPKLAKRLPGG